MLDNGSKPTLFITAALPKCKTLSPPIWISPALIVTVPPLCDSLYSEANYLNRHALQLVTPNQQILSRQCPFVKFFCPFGFHAIFSPMQTSESNIYNRARQHADWLIGAALFGLTLLIYLRTLAPSVAYLFDDSLEFQLLATRMAIAHPTGYPLYSLLIKLATFLPFGDVAYRVNLVSAVCAAGAVMFSYLGARLLTSRFFTANSVVGGILLRAPALIAALVLAFGGTYWSQAILAEVYALQALLTALMLWLVLRWGCWYSNAEPHYASLIPITFLAGLMLTHHRVSILVLPAVVVYILTIDRAFLKRPGLLIKLALAFLLPLLLYLYLPIRGTVTSSLDGAYRNTPEGFLNWILGTAYTVFVTQNPFNETRDAAYFVDLVRTDLTSLGLLVAVAGLVALFLRAWKEWLLLTLALLANLIFLGAYRVADINVFFIPTFVLLALTLAAGLAGMLWLAYYALSGRAATIVSGVVAILLLLMPLSLLRGNYDHVDLSNKTDIIEYGRDMLAQPLPNNSTIVGILGEMTLLRYLQETQGLRPDVQTIAADQEEDRSKAIQEALKQNRTVFVTRPLKGLAEASSLTSLGPLIEVQPKANRGKAPAPEHPLEEDFGDIKLLGYDLTIDGSPRRVTLYWQPQKKSGDLLVSLKLIDANGKLAGQVDRHPVLDAYPTNAWRNGEYVADAYDLPVFVGAAPGEYYLQVTMYDPASGQVIGQRELQKVQVTPQTQSVPRELLGMGTLEQRDLGGIELSGYDLDQGEGFPAGTSLPLTLLWRVPQANTTWEYQLSLEDELGNKVAGETGRAGGAGVAAGQYVRQNVAVNLPQTLVPGKYTMRLAVKGGFPISLQANSDTLGTVNIRAP